MLIRPGSHHKQPSGASSGEQSLSTQTFPPASHDEAAASSAGVPLRRLLLCLLVGVLAGTMSFIVHPTPALPQLTIDVDPVLVGARHLLDGERPYGLVGPDATYRWPWTLYYPMPAVVLAMPIANFPLPIAGALFGAAGAGLLAWGLSRRGLHMLWALASAGVYSAIAIGQWSPLLTGATALGGAWMAVLAAKPSIGAALFVYRPSWRAAIAGGAFVLATVAIWPWWPADWFANVRVGSHLVAPITLPGGFLLLLALLRWRRPETRLLLALACIPQTPGVAETVPLFLIARTRFEVLALACLSWPGALWVRSVEPRTIEEFNRLSGVAMLWTMYLAALIIILRRPSEEDIG